MVEITLKENQNNLIIITSHLKLRNIFYGSDYWGKTIFIIYLKIILKLLVLVMIVIFL